LVRLEDQAQLHELVRGRQAQAARLQDMGTEKPKRTA
jgi:hypothetical protein